MEKLRINYRYVHVHRSPKDQYFLINSGELWPIANGRSVRVSTQISRMRDPHYVCINLADNHVKFKR